MGGGQSSELSYFFNKLIAHVPVFWLLKMVQ